LTGFAWDALIAGNDPPEIFRRGSLAARIEKDDVGSLIMRNLNLDRMRHRLARVAEWYRPANTDRPERPAMPPKDVVRDVLATPDMPLPILNEIVSAPVFASDGTLQTQPGYQSSTCTYYVPADGLAIPPVSEHPSSEDVTRARDIIKGEMLVDFPFTSDADLAHAVGLLLLPFVRRLIGGPTPLHLIEKPSPGTGAGLLCEVLAYPALGRSIPIMTEARDEEEWRKRITAKLMDGPTILLIDNLGARLDSQALAAAITSSTWEDRIMGVSEMVRLPVNCAWVATGNNPSLSSEMARRAIRIRLDAKMDRPHLRPNEMFRHSNLPAWVSTEKVSVGVSV
jgi:hypothetical protein